MKNLVKSGACFLLVALVIWIVSFSEQIDIFFNSYNLTLLRDLFIPICLVAIVVLIIAAFYFLNAVFPDKN